VVAIGRKLALLVIVALLGGTSARAQDLDADKSGARLFASNCASCHHSARGLAKGRFSVTLWYYLKQHYTSSFGSAQALTSYLQSVDAPRARPQPAKSQLARSEPGKSEPGKSEPAKSEPAKSEPAKSPATASQPLTLQSLMSLPAKPPPAAPARPPARGAASKPLVPVVRPPGLVPVRS
jgi:hypothetical protein